MLHTTLLVDPSPLPKESPPTAFGAGAPAEDPMRNFGYTVAAYSVLWCVLLAFVILTWRKQSALDARISQLEGAMSKAQGGKAPGGGLGRAVPSIAHVVFIPGVLLIGMVIGYILGARAARAEIAKRKARLRE